MTYFSGDQVFSHDLDSNLHTGAPYVVHLTMYRHHIANISRSQKIESLYPGCDHGRTPAVLDGHNGSSLIDHTHNNATMHITMRIRIYQFHKPSGGTPRVGNTVSLRQIYFRKSSISIHYSFEWVHIALITPTSYSLHNYILLCHSQQGSFQYTICKKSP